MAPGRTTLLAFNPRSRVCGVPLELPRSGTICTLLNGADSERARPRKTGTERWPTFCGLRANRKNAVRPNRAATHPPLLSDSAVLNSKRAKTLLKSREANLPAHSQPRRSRSVFHALCRKSFVVRQTTGERRMSATRFGNAMRPFIVSARPHTTETVRYGPSATKTT